MKKISWINFLVVLVIVIAVGIYFTVGPMMTRMDQTAESIVRIGVLPDMNAEELQKRYTPLLRYLSEETGLEFELILPTNYAELLHFFGRGEVDLALFGGLTFVQANSLYQAEPLVMRDVDTRFISVFVIRNNDPATELNHLRGKVLAFGSTLSTSGHLMPRYFLQTNKQIIPEKYFGQIVYSGSHDKTAYMVRDGEADLGAVNVEIINDMLRDGRLKQGQLRVVWETPPYPDYVWAVPHQLDQDIKMRLRDAYLQLDVTDKHHRHILSGLGAHSFLPAGTRIFQPLRQIAANLELLGAE
jgi:phosphonate transport system substrate-binding protein